MEAWLLCTQRVESIMVEILCLTPLEAGEGLQSPRQPGPAKPRQCKTMSQDSGTRIHLRASHQERAETGEQQGHDALPRT